MRFARTVSDVNYEHIKEILKPKFAGYDPVRIVEKLLNENEELKAREEERRIDIDELTNLNSKYLQIIENFSEQKH